MHAVGKFFGLRVIWELRLHPDHVAVGSVCYGAVDGTLAAALVPVVAFSRPCCLPVEVYVDAGNTSGNGTCFGVALAFALLQELVDQTLLVDMYASVDSIDYSLMEELEVGLLDPGIFNGLKLSTALASLLCSIHELAQRLECRIGAAQNVVVVSRVNGGSDEGSGF